LFARLALTGIFLDETWRKGLHIRLASECCRKKFIPQLRSSLSECALSLGSQISGHAVCIISVLSNAFAGGVSTSCGYGIGSAVVVGTTFYIITILARSLFDRECSLPNVRLVAFGFALSIAVSVGIDWARAYSHQPPSNDWYNRLSSTDRKQIRNRVRQWMEKRSADRRNALAEAAQLNGYENTEDYIVLNLCGASSEQLSAILEDVRRMYSKAK
jgi:hypothetical protein